MQHRVFNSSQLNKNSVHKYYNYYTKLHTAKKYSLWGIFDKNQHTIRKHY